MMIFFFHYYLSSLPLLLLLLSLGADVSHAQNNETTTIFENSCHVVNPDLSGCDNTECQDFVCGNIPACCSSEEEDGGWTEQCVSLALLDFNRCPYSDEYDDFNCFQYPQPAGCFDPPGCRASVCLASQTCCDILHNEDCAKLAIERCASDLPNGDGNTCYEISEEPGCHDTVSCLPVVCGVNPDCCGISYSEDCIDIARSNPTVCMPPASNNTCVETSMVGGCKEVDCELKVCDIDPTCCRSDDSVGEYTEDCVDIATSTCPGVDDPPTNDCFTTSSRPGCNNSSCVFIVCATNPECCTDEYKPACVQIARQNGGLCGVPEPTNDCNEISDFGGCENTDCESKVCTIKPDCCNQGTQVGEWSTQCTQLAETECQDNELNSCFEAVRTPGCSNQRCQRTICREDDFCCERQWDSNCVEKAMENLNVCNTGFPQQENNCFEVDPFERSGCDNSEFGIESTNSSTTCFDIVCENRRECCNGPYDKDCVNTAYDNCPIPKPEHHCFEKGDEVPGCSDAACAERVCEDEPKCCSTGPWDEDTCINEARNHPDVCKPPKSTNHCGEESLYGGCNDERCETIVCGAEPGCCNNEEETGQWNDFCVTLANDLCQPPVLPRPEGECPSGFTCDSDSMANCTGIRSTMKDAMEFGDLYGGIYCGNPTDDIENCDIGHYCPDPETRIVCPAGYFCPHKSLVPDLIKCAWCKEGAVKLTVDLYGYIVLAVVLAFVILYALYKLAKLYNMTAVDRLHSFQSSFLSNHFGEFEHRMQELKNKVSTRKKPQGEGEDLEKLRPKLELINRRIRELKAEQEAEAARLEAGGDGENGEEGLSVRGGDSKIGSALGKLKSKVSTASTFAVNVSSSSIEDKRAPIEFDARAVFDVLDADDSGDVSFEELNRILGFNELELGEFVRRMNELGGQSKDLESVTRPVFVKYFLQVLKDTTNLTVSFEEAEELFLEMSMGKNEVHMSKFYTSSMSDFLSDIQILDLIKRFKAIKKGNMAYQSGRQNKSGRTGSGRRSTLLQRNQSVVARRQSLFSAGGAGGGGSVASGTMVGVTKQSLMLVSKADFTEHYPQLLLEVTVEDADIFDDEEEGKEDSPGVDISFQNLSLAVNVGGNAFNVVDGVTGRIRGRTMTALMGGSGAGKTSLLNALCGRAFYGETTGMIHVNGQETTIEDHKDMVGFVPQDDIVYAELTVRENLIYAGRFRLPKGTPDDFIEDLADETLANLGLSRVANSPVGDVKRRGVSGGEKKRVNIGLELMAEPAILFLDEPTSGLDASSALLVMKSLKHLVDKQGVTIVSVIHQPRKFIYDLFDSLILLGVGGRMVYHGPTGGVTEYFENLSYTLPPGESVADWLIDISSGRLEPDNRIAGNKKLERLPKQSAAFRDLGSLSKVLEGEESKPSEKPKSAKELNDEVKTPPKEEASKKGDNKSADNRESQRIAVTDSDVVGGKGVTAGKMVAAFEEAKHRRAWLYEQWIIYFENLNRAEKSVYTKPEAYDLPVPFTKPSFGYQFWHQLARQHIVAWRNRVSKLTDCVIIVAAVAIIAGLDGVTEPTVDADPEIAFEILARPILSEDAQTILQQTFRYAYTRQITYALKVGIILSVLLGLTGTKIIVSKRLEFFREAASGYNINAYFFSVNTITLIENSVQVLFASFFCAWFRRPLAGFWSFFVHFQLLAILCLSWSILISLVLPPDQVTLAAGFFFSFCGLLISGAFPPILYKDIYEEGGFKELLSGWLSPTRYFYEALAVGEYRCMPEQSAFTITDEAFNRPYNTSMIIQLGYAGHDPTATRYACNGWYWSVLPVLLVSLTVRYGACLAMHGFSRSQQTKKSLLHEMKKDKMVALRVVLYILGLCALFGISTWAIQREVPFTQPELSREDRIADIISGGGLG